MADEQAGRSRWHMDEMYRVTMPSGRKLLNLLDLDLDYLNDLEARLAAAEATNERLRTAAQYVIDTGGAPHAVVQLGEALKAAILPTESR